VIRIHLTTTVVAATAALAFASSALALGGSAYAKISADWGTPGVVHVHVVSNHSFRGTATTTCGAVVNDTETLDNWYDNPVIHQNQDDFDVNIAAAGSGASCTITVMDGHKLMAQQSFVSN
jgi:hypothetical protein